MTIAQITYFETYDPRDDVDNNTWPTLYKMTATGAIQQWDIRVCPYIEDKMSYQYVVNHGQMNGKIQETSTIVAQGKNSGKANETDAYTQCCAEAESKWKKQRDRKGYTETIPTEKPLRPMLAKSYDKDGKHIKFPCFVYAKLDGLRCLAKRTSTGVELISRQGKRFTAIPHIEQQLMWMKPGMILDGELYIHGEEFQEIISAVKRDKPSTKSGSVEYHVYDVINDKDYDSRYRWLQHNIFIWQANSNHIKYVEAICCESKRDIWKYHNKFTKRGYEGVMLRNLKGPYKINGRSKDLQKVKKFMDEEFEIVGAEPCVGKMKDMCSFTCITKAGIQFNCMPEGTEESRKQMYNDWKLGKIKAGDSLTVKFFSWTTSKNPVPRFPIGRIRTMGGDII